MVAKKNDILFSRFGNMGKASLRQTFSSLIIWTPFLKKYYFLSLKFLFNHVVSQNTLLLPITNWLKSTPLDLPLKDLYQMASFAFHSSFTNIY